MNIAYVSLHIKLLRHDTEPFYDAPFVQYDMYCDSNVITLLHNHVIYGRRNVLSYTLNYTFLGKELV